MRRTIPGAAARCALLLLSVCSAVAAGCGGSAGASNAASDPARSREALTIALDAWRDGQAPGALRERTPPIHVADQDWQSGLRLVDYRVEPGEKAVGYDMRWPVALSLKDERGKPVKRKASYTVAVNPTPSVVRADDF